MKQTLVLPPPTQTNVQLLIDRFESDNVHVEEALQEVVKKFPSNTEMSQVLLKVAAINALYATQIWGVYRAAERIAECAIEDRLKVGDASVVHDIASMEFSGKQRYNYSFATKYCSWHHPNLYPMYDSRVAFCLCVYQKQDPF